MASASSEGDDRAAAAPSRRLAAPALVFAATLLFQLPFFDRWFSFMDEGHLLHYADLIAQGGELYRDATVYPLPGAFWLLALAFKVFGPSNLVARWILVFEFALFVSLLFWLFRRMAGTRTALIAVWILWLYRVWAFPHWHMYSYSTTALLVQLASLSLLVRFFDTGSRRTLALAGLLFGLGVLCKQDYGAAALLAATGTLAVHSRSALVRPGDRLAPLLGWFIAPAAAVGALTGLHFLRQGMLAEVVQLTVTNHFVGMASFEYSSFPRLLPLFTQDPDLRSVDGLIAYVPAILYNADWTLLRGSAFFQQTAILDLALKLYYYAPLVVMPLAGLRLLRRRAELRDAARAGRLLAELVFFGFGAALVLLVWLNKPQDYVHLAVLYWPVLLSALLLARDALAALWRRRPALAAAALALTLLPCGVATAYSTRLAWRLRTLHSEPVPGERGGIFVTPNEARLLSDVIEYVQENAAPDEPVLVLPYYPIVHFLAERRGADRSAYIVWPFPEFPDRDRRIIASLEAQEPDVLVYSFNRLGGFPSVREFAPELFAYLVEHYEIERIFGYKLAGARRRAAPNGRPLLASTGSAAALVIAADDEPPRPVPPDERDRFLALDLWPFRPVVALRPSPAGARTVLALPVEVPHGAHLSSAVGVHPAVWYHHPSSRIRFEIHVAGEGFRELAFSRTLNPTQEISDRGWLEVSVPLERWAGRTVTVELSTSAERESGESLEHGGFALPRLVTRRAGAP
jgi:hypothetical protein